jgi:hypothetical protein
MRRVFKTATWKCCALELFHSMAEDRHDCIPVSCDWFQWNVIEVAKRVSAIVGCDKGKHELNGVMNQPSPPPQPLQFYVVVI